MYLTVKYRLILQSLLAVYKTSETEALIARDIIEKTSFKQDEAEQLGFFINQQGKPDWDHNKDLNPKFEFSDPEIAILQDLRLQLIRDKTIDQDLLPLTLQIKKL